MRVQWIDIVKGIGILLVCLGHSRLGSVGPLASWINSFHMPLFFIMAGLCFDEGRYQSLKGYVWRKCRVLAYPYFMLSLFVATIMTLLCWGSGVNYFDTILVRVFPGQTISGLWFVRVLFFVEISYALLIPVLQWGRVAVVILLAVTGFLLPQIHDLLRLNTICLSLLFYGVGCLFRPYVSCMLKPGKQLCMLLVVSCTHWGYLASKGFPVSSYGDFSFHYSPPLIVLLAMGGTLEISFVAQQFASVKWLSTAFAWLGRNSLLLLVLHPNM